MNSERRCGIKIVFLTKERMYDNMKTYRSLWNNFIDEENVFESIQAALRGKSKNLYVDVVKNDIGWYAEHICDYANDFHSQKHPHKQISDGKNGKIRQLAIPSFDETVIHHMWINAAHELFSKGMYKHTYSSIPGRGLHDAVKYIRRKIKDDPRHCKYFLKLDIRKFFNSVDVEIVKDKLAKYISDKKFLKIGFDILDSEADQGLPLGFYTSHWIANWLLQPLDHYIKEDLGVIYYVRYMDDMIIMGSNKDKLHQVRTRIENYLNEELGLELKKNWQLRRFEHNSSEGIKGHPIDFVGFVFQRDGKVKLRHKLFHRFLKKAKKVIKNQKFTVHDAQQLISYFGWSEWADMHKTYLHYVAKEIPMKRMKEYVSQYFKKQQNINYNYLLKEEY